jgi:hypothetical protein
MLVRLHWLVRLADRGGKGFDRLARLTGRGNGLLLIAAGRHSGKGDWSGWPF